MITSPPPTLDEEHRWSAADFLRVMYLVFGLLGLVGNGLVLFVFIRVPSLKNITNLFIGNQSLIDMVSSVFLLLNKYREEEIDFSKLGRVHGIMVCLFWTSDYVYWALLVASTTNLVIITLERYMAVFKPIMYRYRVNWKSATALAIAVWVFGFIFELFWSAMHRMENGECVMDYRSPTVQAVVGVFVFTMELIIPVIVMLWVYISIWRRLNAKPGKKGNIDHGHPVSKYGMRDTPQIKETPDGAPTMISNGVQAPAESEMHRRIRINVVKTLFLVSFVYIICWTPTQVIFLSYNLGVYDLDFQGMVQAIVVFLAFCNMWINPFIYAFRYRKFQEGLRIVFCYKSSREARGPTASTSLATIS